VPQSWCLRETQVALKALCVLALAASVVAQTTVVERQTLLFSSTPTGGSMRFYFSGSSLDDPEGSFTVDIPAGATGAGIATAVQRALSTFLPSDASGPITVTASTPSSSTFLLTFNFVVGVPQLMVDVAM
jgi:hypothetical protein